MKLMKCVPFAATAAFGLGLSMPAMAQDQTRDDSRYLYQLTPDSAVDCAMVALAMRDAKSESDAEWSRFHNAISLTWFGLANQIHGADLPDAMIDNAVERLRNETDGNPYDLDVLPGLAQPCEIMSNLYGEKYRTAANLLEEAEPEIFADRAAMKNQTGGTYPDSPTKELIFGDWFFFARGNSCIASNVRFEPGEMIFRFTNFFDGEMTLEWDGLPEISEELDGDAYEAAVKAHRVGVGYSDDEDDYLPRIAEGYTYETFPGTGIFIDNVLIATVDGHGKTLGKKYSLGGTLQRPYYNMMPLGSELSIKVMGEETHRIRIDNAAFWNEMGNCMAQYPFG